MSGGRRRAALVVALGLVAGCGGGEPSGQQVQEPVAQVAAPEEPTTDGTATLHRFLPDEMRRSTRPQTFPHEAHVQIDCSVCHQVAEGHGSHTTVECASCHRASAMVTVRSLGPADCQTCHHVTQQTWTCEHCHGSPGAYETSQELTLGVWSAPRVRTLHFEHARHQTLTCRECHRSEPSLTPEGCASCHESHHVATARCQSCHTPSPLAAHDVDAHLTCGGGGCHDAPLVEALADTRAVCLVCHQAQEGHEAGRECVECHRVRPGLGGGTGQ
jgi:hypothetical protein